MIANAFHNSKDAHLLAALVGDQSSLDRVLQLSQLELIRITGQKYCILPDLEYEDIAMEAIEKMLDSELSSKQYPWSYYCKSLANCFLDHIKKMHRRPICEPMNEETPETRYFEPIFTQYPQKLANLASSHPTECLILLSKMYGLTQAESYEIYEMTAQILDYSKRIRRSSYADLVQKICEPNLSNPYFALLLDSVTIADLEACIAHNYPQIYQFLLSKLHNIAA